MKKVTLILMMFIASLSYSQTYELPENGTIVLDSTLTSIVNAEYNNEKKWRDPGKLEFYDKRIQNIMTKYYWVVENELEKARKNGWFETSFKHSLDNAITRRIKFANR